MMSTPWFCRYSWGLSFMVDWAWPLAWSESEMAAAIAIRGYFIDTKCTELGWGGGRSDKQFLFSAKISSTCSLKARLAYCLPFVLLLFLRIVDQSLSLPVRIRLVFICLY